MNISDEVRFQISADEIDKPPSMKSRDKQTNIHSRSQSNVKINRKKKPDSVRFQLIVNNDGLIELDLGNRKLQSLQHDVFTMSRMEVLKLNGNELHSLPREISRLRQLKKLFARSNSIVLLPITICNLKHLNDLDLSHNKIHVLPSEITMLNRLRVFNLGYNNLQILPNTFGEMTSLRQLELPGNHLWQLPVSFKKLKKIKYLNLGKNKFDKVPIVLCSLSELKGLDLQGNSIMTAPHQLMKLSKLKELNLACNKLEELPMVITMLKQLHSLDVSKNSLQSLPLEIQHLSKLKMINVQGNSLFLMPQIPSLFYLNVADNKIQQLSMSKVKSLKYINASHNYLENMPLGIYNQKYLEVLKLKNNNIDYVSQDIVVLQNLTHLDLSNNRLQTLPHVIYDLDKLLHFNVMGNPIEQRLRPRARPNNVSDMTANTQETHPHAPLADMPTKIHHPIISQYQSQGNHLNSTAKLKGSSKPSNLWLSGIKNKTYLASETKQVGTQYTPKSTNISTRTPQLSQYTKTKQLRPSSNFEQSQTTENMAHYKHIGMKQGNPYISSLGSMSLMYKENKESIFSSQPRSRTSVCSNQATVAESEPVGDDISLGDQDYQYQPTSVQDVRLKGVASEIELLLKKQLLNP